MLSTKMKPHYRNSKKQKVIDRQTSQSCAQTSLDALASTSEQTSRNIAPSCGLVLKKEE